MNCLFVKVDWNGTLNSQAMLETCRFNNGIIDLRIERISNFLFDNIGFFYNEKSKVVTAMVGYISNLEQVKSTYGINHKDDVEIVERLYSLVKLEFISELDGIYSIAIFDFDRGKGYVFQDRYGSDLPIYYIGTENEFCFSTSLKQILRDVTFKRTLNVSAVNDFLYYKSIVPNSSTLIEYVNKLAPRQGLIIDLTTRCVDLVNVKRKHKTVSRTFAKNNIIKSIKTHTEVLVKQLSNGNPPSALSGGFDSNLLLHFLREAKGDVIDVITIGGKKINEVPQTKRILDNYVGVKQIIRIVDEHALDYYPDIVWRTEGYVFEVGLFLKYEFAKAANGKKRTSVLVAECADQLLDIDRHAIRFKIMEMIWHLVQRTPIINLSHFLGMKGVPDRFIKISRMHSKNQGYDITLDYILKKSGLILNSFGIQGLYPFLNEDTRTMGISLARLNHEKRLYKRQVSRLLGSRIAKNLCKIGGATDVVYLIDSRKELVLEIIKSAFISELVDKSLINRISNRPEQYPAFVLRLLYIYLFSELFISGKYDSTFGENEFINTLSSFPPMT